jgi:hypothetical protein
MKFSLLCFFCFVFLFPSFGKAEENINDQPLIIEVQIAGSQASQDYLRLYNPSQQSIDLSHYQLKKRTQSGKEYSLFTFPEGTQMDPQENLIWANSQDSFGDFFPTPFQSQASLAKDNSLALFDPQKNIVEALAWGKGENPFREGNPFPENPKANQLLKRKQFQGEYIDSQNNQVDFFLEDYQLTADQATDNLVLGDQTPKKISPLTAFFISLGLGVASSGLILFLKNKL